MWKIYKAISRILNLKTQKTAFSITMAVKQQFTFIPNLNCNPKFGKLPSKYFLVELVAAGLPRYQSEVDHKHFF